MKRVILLSISLALLFLFDPLGLAVSSAQAQGPDMVSPASDGGRCLTVNGTDVTTAPGLTLDTCRGTPQQMWTRDVATGKWQTGLDPTYCLAANSTGPGNALNVRLCTDARALALEVNPDDAESWGIIGSGTGGGRKVIDWGVYGFPAVASYNGWSYQHFSWLQPDVDVVNAQGCMIPYPLLVTDTAGYDRELACDHVAKVQPPYYNANAARDPAVWPGAVASGATPITRTFTFDLDFKDNGYMRTSVRPKNWLATGLYAPAGQILNINVTGATAAEMSKVYALLGVHTDILKPSQATVTGPGQFNRYPNVTTKVRLVPGDNLVRTPYGGVIELLSDTSIAKSITVTISNAVETPHFVLGQTTEAEWLALRNAPGPWAVIETDLVVLYVAKSDIQTHSFADITGVAQYYRNLVDYQNELMGVSASDPLSYHQLPQGQHRFVNDIQISAGAAHSGFPMMFGDYPMADPMKTFLRSTDMTWGNSHELGHNNQMGAWASVYGIESTNNIFVLYTQEKLFGVSRIVEDDRYTKAMAVLNDPGSTDKWTDVGIWGKIVFLDQIRLGFPALNWNYYADTYRRYRAMSSAEYSAINTNQLRYDTFMEIMCDVTNANLTPHFETYMVPVSQTPKDHCATKPALTRNLWEINNEQPLWYHAGSGTGSFLREYWTDISGTEISALTGHATYPNNPSGSELLTTGLEGPKDFGDNYGERLRGYIHPPVSGDYRFWLSGDNTAQLLLSTDEDPANATTIVTLPSASGYQKFDVQAMSVQRSAAITLQAGQRYYIEVLHKESTGSDSVSVAWNIPATASYPGEVRKVIDAQYLSPYNGDVALQKDLAPGQATIIAPGADVKFRITLTNNGSAPVQNVQVVDALPSGFSLSAADTNGWSSGYRYVRFEADSEDGASTNTTTAAEIGLLDENGTPISKTGWTATASSESNPGDALLAIDGDSSTSWGTEWRSGTAPWPHTITIDTGALRKLSGFTYLPRQNSVNGRVGGYKFFVSEDGSNWTEVATGTFTYSGSSDRTERTVTFTPPAPNALATVAGPIAPAPAASATIDIILTADTGLVTGTYINTASIASMQDLTNSNVPNATTANNADTASVEVDNATAITLASFTAVQGSTGVTVAWETGTEIDNAGFNLYHATDPAGPYTKINASLIPAKGEAVSGASYSYLDTAASDAGAITYYKLEDINLNGVSTFHGPVNTGSGMTVGLGFDNHLYLPLILR